MDPYVEAALLNVARLGLSVEDVAAMGYTQIAALCGVTLGPNGESPADFNWKPIRQQIVNAMTAQAEALERAQVRLDIEAAQRTYPRLQRFAIYDEEDGFALR